MTRRREQPSPRRPSSDARQIGYEFEASLEAGPRRASGSYYTPQSVIRYIVNQTLGPILRGENRDGALRNIPLTHEEILELKILDPAMGAGHFLIEATDYLSRAYIKAGGRKRNVRGRIAGRCIFGVDIDPQAVSVARKSLSLITMDDYGVSGNTVRNLKHGDALIEKKSDGLPDGHPVFNWEKEFPELFDPQASGFDAVIGNPPYVSFGLRGMAKIDARLREYYLRTYPGSAQYKISLYALFLERAMTLLSDSGLMGFVLPDSFLLGKYFQGLREKVFSCGSRIRSLTLFQNSFWRGGEVGSPVILIAGRNTDRRRRIHLSQVRDIESLATGRPVSSFRVPYRIYGSTPLSRFYFFRSKNEVDIYRHVSASDIRLSQLVKFYSGLIGKSGKNSTVFDDAASNDLPHRRSKLVETGRRLGAFRLEWSGRYMLHDPALYKSGYTPAFYENPKLVLNQTGDSPKACVDLSGLYCLNNMHVGRPLGNEDALYLVAGILNSRFGRTFYQFLSMEKGRAMAQIDIDVIDLFPMPPGSLAFADPDAKVDPLPRRIAALSRELHEIVRDENRFGTAMAELDRLVLDAYGIDSAAFDLCYPLARITEGSP